jgi:glucosamine--fructose-6-phosphate aminotransferase (isomerizing)
VARKEGYRYFMEKEIYEQPQVLADILTGRLRDNGVVPAIMRASC